jgi:NADH:ubiquinone oxidoreductase subunit E
MPRRIPREARDDVAPVSSACAFDLAPLAVIVSTCGGSHADLMAVLQRAQEQYGYLPQPVIEEIARLTRIPASHVYGVITFYDPFTTVPPARHKVCVCEGTACHVRGGDELLHAAERHLGIVAGEQTQDGSFSLETVACLGACSYAPLATVDGTFLPTMAARDMPMAIAAAADAEEHDLDA